jgi:hypothetical protein
MISASARRIPGIASPIGQHETNHCPGCGKSHWMIGRLTAECAFCGTALPLIAAVGQRRASGCSGHAHGGLRDRSSL